MHQTLVSPPSRPTDRRRPRRRTARLTARLTAAALLALTALSSSARPAEAVATPESYQACMNAVMQLYEGCRDNASSPIGDFACMWAGGVGLIGCAVAEALEMLARGVILPRPY